MIEVICPGVPFHSKFIMCDCVPNRHEAIRHLTHPSAAQVHPASCNLLRPKFTDGDSLKGVHQGPTRICRKGAGAGNFYIENERVYVCVV